MRYIVLKDDKHNGRECYHPKKGVAVIGTGSKVGSPVTRIDKSYRYQQSRANVLEYIQRSQLRFVVFVVDIF